MLKNLIIFFCLLIILSLIYLPVLLGHYIYHDDLALLENTGFFVYIYSNNVIAMGRPLAAALATIFDWMVNSIKDLHVVRFLTIVELSICGLIVFRCLRRYILSEFTALLATIIILTLPSFEVLVANTTPICLTALLLSLFGAIFVDKIPEQKFTGKRLMSRNAFFSTMFLLIALLTYPPTAMFYWVMAGIVLFAYLDNPSDALKQKLINLFCIGFAALFFYATILKIIQPMVLDTVGGYNPYFITNEYSRKIKWFIEIPLVSSLNLWNISPKDQPALMAAIFFFSAWLLHLRHVIKNQANIHREIPRQFTIFLIFLSLMILCFLPNLLAFSDASFYRCTTALTSLLAVALIWAAKKWIMVLFKVKDQFVMTFLVSFICIYGAQQAFRNVLLFRVIPSGLEVNYLKQLLDVNINQYQRIHLIRQQQAIAWWYDEFGTLSTNYMQNVEPMVRCALKELRGGDIRHYGIIITSSLSQQKISFKEKTLLIDMARLNDTLTYLQYSNPNETRKPK